MFALHKIHVIKLSQFHLSVSIWALIQCRPAKVAQQFNLNNARWTPESRSFVIVRKPCSAKPYGRKARLFVTRPSGCLQDSSRKYLK